MTNDTAIDDVAQEALEEIQRVKDAIDLKLKSPMFSTAFDRGVEIPLRYTLDDDTLLRLMEEIDEQGHRIVPVYEGDVPTSLRLFPYGGARA